VGPATLLRDRHCQGHAGHRHRRACCADIAVFRPVLVLGEFRQESRLLGLLPIVRPAPDRAVLQVRLWRTRIGLISPIECAIAGRITQIPKFDWRPGFLCVFGHGLLCHSVRIGNCGPRRGGLRRRNNRLKNPPSQSSLRFSAAARCRSCFSILRRAAIRSWTL
jgi:hypothetical protein